MPRPSSPAPSRPVPRPTPAVDPPRRRGGPALRAGALALAAPVLVGLAAAPPAAAKGRHAPCPTAGTTLMRSSAYAAPRYRVYRTGPALRLCSRSPGERRRIRSLGTWTPATRLTGTGSAVAWTTRRTVSGAPADTVRVLDVATGRRRTPITRAAVSTGPSVPASPDTVVALRLDDLVLAWVTGGGRLAARVTFPEDVPAPDVPPGPFHVGPVYALRDVGPALAPELTKGLVLIDDSQTDDCGGTLSRRISIPAVPGFPAGNFTYFEKESEPSSGCS